MAVPDLVVTLLSFAVLLQVKHVIADYLLQSPFILDNRHRYGHPGGLLHVGYHVAGTVLILVGIGTSWGVILLLGVLEALFHYHLDWAKDNFTRSRGLGTGDSLFWWAIGIDQFLHQLSYIALIALWLLWQAG